jgi:23S rRNA pseudouridine1911/1915/1917 synthase
MNGKTIPVDHDDGDAGEERQFSIEPELGGARLDKALALLAPDLSRSRLKALIEAGQVRVGDAIVFDAARKMRPDELVVLVVPPPEMAEPQPEAMPLAIVHEDADLIVIDKPAGLVVHPAPGHSGGTLVNGLLHHCGASLSGIGGVRRPGIVHRLDKDTSGLLVVAKNDAAHKSLAAQFADHGREGDLLREYRAFVWGVPDRQHGTIEAALDRAKDHRERMAVVRADKGRFAITHYAVLERFDGHAIGNVASLIACQLETGRTHQIRVHMAHIGHPLLADPLYGQGFRTKASQLRADAQDALAKLGDRQALHAAKLGFRHPRSGELLEFESDFPADLDQLHKAMSLTTP